jgi:AcrR family transcriptional regulator
MSPAVRREQLIETAISILADEGLDALRMDHLATTAGVTRPVVYAHFADRQALVIAVMQHLMLEVGIAISVAEAHDDLPGALAAATHGYFGVVASRGPAMRAVMLTQGFSPEFDAQRRGLVAIAVRRWAERCRAHTGLSLRDSETVVQAQLASLYTIADRWMNGLISRRRAEQLFVTSALAALDALRDAT